jgi:hypothetical protein
LTKSESSSGAEPILRSTSSSNAASNAIGRTVIAMAAMLDVLVRIGALGAPLRRVRHMASCA